MTRILRTMVLSLTMMPTAGLLQAETIDPQRGVLDPDGKTVWYDGQLLGVEGKGWTDTAAFYDRLPAKAATTVPTLVWDLSHDSAGLAVRFTTDAASIQVRWTLLKPAPGMPHMPATGVSGVDLYERNETGQWRFLANGRPTQETNLASFGLTAGREHLLYLPLYNGVKSIAIGVPKDKTISTPKQAQGKPLKPVLFYGTSITQGGCASRPGMAATAIVGRELDRPVINLGFSGSGKMEPEMADLLVELDPAVFVLDCLWNMTPEMVTERVEPFVRKLRTTHPATPILLAEDSSFCNSTPTGKGTLLRKAFDKLTQDGIKDLYFLPNTAMLGDDCEGTVDGCHPNDLGMMRQAAVFTKALRPLLPPVEPPGVNNPAK